MEHFRHPKDPTLRYPLVKDTLNSPQEMIESLFNEFIENRISFDSLNNIIYRKYEDHVGTDAISCHFDEEIRALCRVSKYPRIIDIWRSMSPKEIRSFKTIDSIRYHILYKMKAKECNFFNPALCIILYLRYSPQVGPIKIIDPSAGWGDRMIAAIAAGDFVSEYHGYDPNTDLEVPYQRIIDTLDTRKKCKVSIEPFQNAIVKENYYDIALTSPPYFNLEVYSTSDTQSYNDETRDYDKWKELFYYKYLSNMVKAVRPGGRIIMYVSNYRDIDGNIIPLENDTINLLAKAGAKKIIKGEYRTHRIDEPSRGIPRSYYVFDVDKKI